MLMLTPTMTTIFLIDSDKPVNFDSVTEAVNYYFTTTPLDSPFFKRRPSLPDEFFKITSPGPWNRELVSESLTKNKKPEKFFLHLSISFLGTIIVSQRTRTSLQIYRELSF